MTIRRPVTVTAAKITAAAVVAAAVITGVFGLARRKETPIVIEQTPWAHDSIKLGNRSTQSSHASTSPPIVPDTTPTQRTSVDAAVSSMYNNQADVNEAPVKKPQAAEADSVETSRLIELLEMRANLIRGEMDLKDSLLARGFLMGEPPDTLLKLRSARRTFEELHQKHIAALRGGQSVLAHEIENEIDELLEAVLPGGTGRDMRYGPE